MRRPDGSKHCDLCEEDGNVVVRVISVPVGQANPAHTRLLFLCNEHHMALHKALTDLGVTED